MVFSAIPGKLAMEAGGVIPEMDARVDLIAEDGDVAVAQHGGNFREIPARNGAAGGVVRRIQNDQPGFVRQTVEEEVEVEGEPADSLRVAWARECRRRSGS